MQLNKIVEKIKKYEGILEKAKQNKDEQWMIDWLNDRLDYYWIVYIQKVEKGE